MVIHESTRLIAENYERVWARSHYRRLSSQLSSSKQNPMFPIGFEI